MHINTSRKRRFATAKQRCFINSLDNRGARRGQFGSPDSPRHERALCRAHHAHRDSASRRERSSLRLVSASSIAIPGWSPAERRENSGQDFAADDIAGGDAHGAVLRRPFRGRAPQRGGSRRHSLDMRRKILIAAAVGARPRGDRANRATPKPAPGRRRDVRPLAGRCPAAGRRRTGCRRTTSRKVRSSSQFGSRSSHTFLNSRSDREYAISYRSGGRSYGDWEPARGRRHGSKL